MLGEILEKTRKQNPLVHCMVNLVTGKYNANKEPGVFLKLGYFEDVDQLSPEVLAKIAAILEDPDSRIEI